MQNLEALHFEQLKNEVQAQYLNDHTPSQDDISQWKGIDIIYFQEDLRKKAKGNISEKSFYTYFKNANNAKLPRIDMLNILSIYAGYASWYDFKKNHLFANEILESETVEEQTSEQSEEIIPEEEIIADNTTPEEQKTDQIPTDSGVLQESVIDNQHVNESGKKSQTAAIPDQEKKNSVKKYIWAAAAAFIATVAGIFGYNNGIFDSKYTFCFEDADRNENIHSSLDIKVFKENESPIYYRINPGECFYYSTKDKTLKMEITSPLYENLLVSRSLEDAPDEERIRLKPDDYKTAVYYFSRKEVSGDPELIKQKRRELERRISDNATILQLFDNDVYGIETLDKQKYITLVTTPTTSLKNLSVIEMKRESGKIVSIKFKIKEDDENN